MALLNSVEGLNDRIAIFTIKDCSRSKFVRDFMNGKKIPFTEFKTSKNELHERLVWSLLRTENPDILRILYPVVIIDGAISHDIEDLKSFTRILASGKN